LLCVANVPVDMIVGFILREILGGPGRGKRWGGWW
jgi:hypothetical protein